MRHAALGRNLLKIAGSDPLLNCVQIPRPKNGKLKSLQLTGAFVSLFFQILPEHLFLVNLDFTVTLPVQGQRVFFRISLSNLFECDRKSEDGSLYIAVPSTVNWNFVQLDLAELFQEFYGFGEFSHELDSVEICSNQVMKGIYTSNKPLTLMDIGVPPDFYADYTVLSLIHISDPTTLAHISYAVFCLKKKHF